MPILVRLCLALFGLLAVSGTHGARAQFGNSSQSYTDQQAVAAGQVAGFQTGSQVTTTATTVADTVITPPLVSMASGRAPSTIYVPTAAQTINTTGDTSCFSATGVGPGLTITGGVPYAGNRFRLRCNGIYTTPLANAAAVTMKVKWGATVVASNTTVALTSSLTNMPFYIEETCTIQSSGASGTMVCSGHIDFAVAALNIALLSTSVFTASASTINTTATSKLDITMALSGVVGSPALTVTDGSAEILY